MNEVFVFTETLDCFTSKQEFTLFDSDESSKRKQAVKKQLKIISEEEFLVICINQLVKYRNLETESR